jgi:hypothetical protein
MKRSIICAAAAVAAIGGAGVTAVASSSSAPANASPATASVGIAAGGPGWQSDYVYSVPPGIGALFFHYPCPGALVAGSGKFVVDFADPAANSVHLIGQGVRTDVPGKHEYAWYVNWFGAGAPTGSRITFNVHCVKK